MSGYLENGSNKLISYGKELVDGEEKTKNKYSKGNEDTIELNYLENRNRYGDALYETSSNINAPWDLSWYGDFSYYPYSEEPFFLRGGSFTDTTSSGVFSCIYEDGNIYRSVSFRPVLI